jgi:hypothetical protein
MLASTETGVDWQRRLARVVRVVLIVERSEEKALQSGLSQAPDGCYGSSPTRVSRRSSTVCRSRRPSSTQCTNTSAPTT